MSITRNEINIILIIKYYGIRIPNINCVQYEFNNI